MVSFSSSVINKSGKKFAPKAPGRRVGATSACSQSARASTDRQTTSKTPQPPPSSITPEVAAPDPSNDPAKSTPQPAKDSSQSPPPPPPQQQEPPTPSQSLSPPIPLSIQHKVKSTTIAIPTPRRGPSFPSVQEPRPQPPHPTATPVTASIRNAPSLETFLPTAEKLQPDRRQIPQITQNAPESPKRQRVEQAVDSRPAKRTKVVEPVTKPISTSQEEPSHPGARTQVQQAPREAVPATKRPAKKIAKRSTDRRQSADQIEDGIGAAATERKPRARRKRQPTPEDAESIEITPTVVKMSDLCRDLRTGKKSKREIELQSMDLTELARKQKEREERIRNGHRTPKADSAERSTVGDDIDRAEVAALGGPQMRIVNGEIVVDAASLQIDRHANAARNEGDMEEVEENPLTKRINAASFGRRTKVESWDEEMTDLFYRGLRMFGTDFMMISKMFPGRSRRQIKLKFSNEERRFPERIKQTLLGPREAVDLATYSEMTNTVYDDPRVIEKELDEERKRIEAEHAREKEAKEELLRNPSGVSSSSAVTPAGPSDSNVLPSIEGGVGSGGTRGRKKVAGAHKFGGGTEEILGTIDDIAISA
ncbi:hypothetical protein ACJ73_06351 [Blastomyces percursus]|uniref:Myb-like domain-containing protein n=1 Tax=Blastomyces percursus TaxID=1658174 RepID=A0A1J9R2R1_9EURO|nr:hypothetical protein ACJ73_06351 [Blastomyces percursus]